MYLVLGVAGMSAWVGALLGAGLVALEAVRMCSGPGGLRLGAQLYWYSRIFWQIIPTDPAAVFRSSVLSE